MADQPHQQQAWQQGSWYWLSDPLGGWLAVELISQADGVLTLHTPEGEAHTWPAAQPLRAALPSSLVGVANLLDLEELHDGAILQTLRARYLKDQIYTSISSICLSINPYKQLACYGPSQIAHYRRSLARRNQGGAEPTSTEQELPPHVYALADDAYTSLLRDGVNQAVIISGESGAGKTEAVKLVLQYLTEVSAHGRDETIAQQILEANPILEAFGNAKTVRNNNSSRFGKWMEVHFDEAHRIGGARIFSYLLEKSRVVMQSEGERNYHSFFQLAAGASPEERASLHLPPRTDASGAPCAQHFRLLRRGASLAVEGQDDVADYADLRNAMRVLNFAPSEETILLRVLAAILHVGNIDFEAAADEPASSSSDRVERFAVSNASTSLDLACELLALDPAVCARALLTRQLRIAGGEVITVFNAASVCADNRDTLAKALYEALFQHLISRINSTLGLHSPQQPKLIGVLDIFGFEDFHETGNSFEQLLINLSNEKLNEHFIDHIFRLESRIYASEEVDVSDIPFTDHALCVALIEERRLGILDMVAEEIRLPKGNDGNLLSRMHDAFAPQAGSGASTTLTPAATRLAQLGAYYLKPKTREAVFGVRHYAGDVTYQIKEFMAKSRDALSEALGACVASSREPTVAKLLDKPAVAAPPAGPLSPSALTIPSSSTGPMPPSSPMSPFSPASPSSVSSSSSSITSPASRNGTLKGSSGAAAAPLTLGAQFRSQLADLLATLGVCCANFLRCLKPNACKLADQFDSAFVLRQLQYLGVAGVIAIRQKGYPVRMTYSAFIKRYRLILDKPEELEMAAKVLASPAGDAAADEKALATLLFGRVRAADADWRLGRTQVFFRAGLQSRLEGARDERFVAAVVRAQALWRGRMARKRVALWRPCLKRIIAALANANDQDASAPSKASSILAEMDDALAEAEQVGLACALVPTCARARARLGETSQARRALEAACSSKDATLLGQAIERAGVVNLPSDTKELVQATELLARLKAYHAARADALASRSIPALQAVLAEAAELGLDAENERDVASLLKRLVVCAEITTKLQDLLNNRGPLKDMQEAVAQAEAAGMVVASPASDVERDQAVILVRAQELLTLLGREVTALASLASAVAGGALGPLDACLHSLLGDASLVFVHTHSDVAAAQTLRTHLLAAAQASELASNLRASFAGRDASYIAASLQALRELDQEAMNTLPDAQQLQADAETLLSQLRLRAQAVAALSHALGERSEAALVAAIQQADELDQADSLIQLAQTSEHAAATKLLTSLRAATLALESACSGADLVALEAALSEATRLGLTSPQVRVAQDRRAQMLAAREAERLLQAALHAQEQAMLVHACEKAKAAGIEDSPAFIAAQEALATIAENAANEASMDLALQQQARAAHEAEEAAAAASAAVAAQAEQDAAAQASAASSSSSSLAASSSAAPPSIARPFHSDTYRARHFALSLFPLLRTPEDFSRGKIFGRGKVSSSMLAWSKDPLPRSLLRLQGVAGAGHGVVGHSAPLTADELNTEAMTLFKSIQGFMGDRVYSFADSLGCEVLGRALACEPLRDEVLVQLAKQLSSNSSGESVRKGWQLLALALETFPPSAGLKPFLFNFLLAFADQSESALFHSRAYVSFCLRTLQRDLPARPQPPSIDHVSAFRERVMASAVVLVGFPDGSAVELDLDATMTAEASVALLAQHVGLASSPKQLKTFGIYQITPGQEPLYITQNECLLDYPAAKPQAPSPPGGADETPSYRFLFAKRIWRPLDEEFAMSLNEAATAAAASGLHAPTLSSFGVGDLVPSDRNLCALLYFQLVRDVAEARLDTSRDELRRLAAAHQRVLDSGVFARIADAPPNAAAEASLAPPALQPPTPSSPDDLAAFRSEVVALACTLASPRDYCPLFSLRSYSSRPQLGLQSFTVANTEIKVLPSMLRVGATRNGVFLLEAAPSPRVLKQYKFAHLAGWAANAARFSVRVLVGRAQTQQLNFGTKQAKRIAQTLQQFAEVILEQNARAQAQAALVAQQSSPSPEGVPSLPPSLPPPLEGQ